MKANKNALHLALARACVSTGELSKLSGLPHQSVINVMCGKSVRPVTIGKIARALGVDVSEIIETEKED